MSNTDNTLSEELKDDIKKASLEYLSKKYADGYVAKRYKMFDDGVVGIPWDWTAIRQAHESGATEYAQYKQKFEFVLQQWEFCFKEALKRSRAFTDAEIEDHWQSVKSLTK